jgi:hypothetical protein
MVARTILTFVQELELSHLLPGDPEDGGSPSHLCQVLEQSHLLPGDPEDGGSPSHLCPGAGARPPPPWRAWDGVGRKVITCSQELELGHLLPGDPNDGGGLCHL